MQHYSLRSPNEIKVYIEPYNHRATFLWTSQQVNSAEENSLGLQVIRLWIMV